MKPLHNIFQKTMHARDIIKIRDHSSISMNERRGRGEPTPQVDILHRFEAAVAAIQDSDSFRRWLDVSSRFYRYSLGNQLLIAAQRPDSTYVAGFTAWLKLGRHVKRGEKGIAIMVPYRRTVTTEAGEEEQRVTGFGTGYVFDVAQTEGEPLPRVDVPTLAGDAGGELWQGLARFADQEGVRVLTVPSEELPRETMGSYIPSRREIVVGQSSQRQMTKTLAHELGHHVARVDDRAENECLAEGIGASCKLMEVSVCDTWPTCCDRANPDRTGCRSITGGLKLREHAGAAEVAKAAARQYEQSYGEGNRTVGRPVQNRQPLPNGNLWGGAVLAVPYRYDGNRPIPREGVTGAGTPATRVQRGCKSAYGQRDGAYGSVMRTAMGTGEGGDVTRAGPVDGTPACVTADRAAVVVGDRESRSQGEGPQEPRLDCTLRDNMPAIACRMTVPDLQQRLAQKAGGHPDHRFGHLYDLLTWAPLLDAAADRLLGNKGARTPGLDGVDRQKLRDNREYHRDLLRSQLKDGSFRPMPVKRVYIPKRNGKQRPLGIPTLYDRWVQMAIKLVLEPIFESDFLSFSHGFRPRRSCHTAMAQMHALTVRRQNKVYWVIEGDIEGFFDNVHHQTLMNLLRQRIRDQRLLDLIWRFLRAGVMEGQLFKKTATGTPQGGVLSPLLANVYLNRFDQWFADRAHLGTGSKGYNARYRERRAGHANFMMVRYADDFVIFSNGSKAETEAFKAEVKQWLADELKLTLSEAKTKLTHYTDGIEFLGFMVKKTIGRSSGKEIVTHYPSTASVQRAVQRVKRLTNRSTLYHSPEDQIEALNAFLRGWGEYFRHSASKGALKYVGAYTWGRMWRWLNRKHGGGHKWRYVKAKYLRDNTWQVGKRRLVILQAMPVEYPRCETIPNPYLRGAGSSEPQHYDPFLTGDWNGRHAYGADWTATRDAVHAEARGQCAVCGGTAVVDVHHRKPKAQRGGNVTTNLVPLCRSHHRLAGKRNSAVSHGLREKRTRGSGEPDAGKLARPVREEGL